MPRALDGITVFDISVGEACALATMMLSDNGARVIRVSNPEDERRRNSQTYRMLDRGKESVHLDLNQALKEFSKTDTTADEVERQVIMAVVVSSNVFVSWHIVVSDGSSMQAGGGESYGPSIYAVFLV